MKDLYDFIMDLIDNLTIGNRARRILIIIVVIVFIVLSIAIFSVKLIEKSRKRFLPHRQKFLDRINHTHDLFLECDTMFHNNNRAGETVRYLRKIDESIGKIYVYYSNHAIQLQNYAVFMPALKDKRKELDLKWIYLCGLNAYINAGSPSGKQERNWDALDISSLELKDLYDRTRKLLFELRESVYSDIPLEYQSNAGQDDEEGQS